LIQHIVKIASDKDDLILDFMAGSGTTGHAVLQMNIEDKGNRNFILCTNNENDIATKVCYPRVVSVIKGYTTPKKEKVAGLGGNLKYYKTAFVKNSISRDDLKMRITRECTEMLCLREGIFNEVKAKSDYHIFEQNGRIMGVYYSMERDSLAQLKKELDSMEGEKILYCFTFDPLGLDKNDFVDWQGVNLEPIPQKILDIYEQIYEY
jgi:adenine-specific DNA-methyltransferase